MRNFKTVGIVFGMSAALAACQTSKVVTPQSNVAAQPSPAVSKEAAINGRWLPKDDAARKVYFNEFRDGKFVSKSPDGATTIAAGQYKVAENGDIQMNWYSEARKANSSAMCRQLTVQELQCTSNGSVFNLVKA